jgi:hypothetical protein
MNDLVLCSKEDGGELLPARIMGVNEDGATFAVLFDTMEGDSSCPASRIMPRVDENASDAGDSSAAEGQAASSKSKTKVKKSGVGWNSGGTTSQQSESDLLNVAAAAAAPAATAAPAAVTCNGFTVGDVVDFKDMVAKKIISGATITAIDAELESASVRIPSGDEQKGIPLGLVKKSKGSSSSSSSKKSGKDGSKSSSGTRVTNSKAIPVS